MSHSKIAIRVDDLTVAYNYKPVLWDIDLEVPEGVLMAIVGPNGAGKSTLIKSILGIIDPIAGSVSIYGKPYDKQRKLGTKGPQKGKGKWEFPNNATERGNKGNQRKVSRKKTPGKKEKKTTTKATKKSGKPPFKRKKKNQTTRRQKQPGFPAKTTRQKATNQFKDEPFQGVDATTEIAIINIPKKITKTRKNGRGRQQQLKNGTKKFERGNFLKGKKIATGPVKDIFNDGNLTKTYGINYKVAVNQ
ncbi:ATP-binding cassette domain-containing protein [Dokdonia sp. PRO95]|uniref:ATP-binding cassette domain-containing protein n=1 Tax=Dokdonia sp. PRO95 TaxID=1239415 RepID=UPI000550A5C5|nr:ATP-binding cassette domain-containing protein [Dokdonia sp. PRO95]